MGYKNDDRCLQKAYEDERLFVLMARDPTAPFVIIDWIKCNIQIQPPEKLREALDTAIEMMDTQKHFHNKKTVAEMDNKFTANLPE